VSLGVGGSRVPAVGKGGAADTPQPQASRERNSQWTCFMAEILEPLRRSVGVLPHPTPVRWRTDAVAAGQNRWKAVSASAYAYANQITERDGKLQGAEKCSQVPPSPVPTELLRPCAWPRRHCARVKPHWAAACAHAWTNPRPLRPVRTSWHGWCISC